MSKINNVIPKQNYEFVGMRIADILTDEIDNQFKLTYDTDLDLDEIFLERMVPIDVAEMSSINVFLSTGTYDNKHQASVRGEYTFIIECTAKASTTGDLRGDTSASLKAQRLAGLVRAILENPIYRTLGFAPPFIQRTLVGEIKMGVPKGNPDSNNVSIAMLQFTVVVAETTSLLEPSVLAEFLTTVKLDETEQGYQYKGENYP